MPRKHRAFGDFFVGLPELESGFRDPQPRVIPIYHSPFKLLNILSNCLTQFARSFLFGLIECFNTAGADFYPPPAGKRRFVRDARPLQIGILAVAVDDIVMAAQSSRILSLMVIKVQNYFFTFLG
ncbi:MAG: hypothetical protein AAB566_01300 [Patescibacteria group bacterium]